jgi:hypothetical protein
MTRAIDKRLSDRGNPHREGAQFADAASPVYDLPRDVSWYIALPAGAALLGLASALIMITLSPLL